MGMYSCFESSAGDCEVDWDAMDTAVLFGYSWFEITYKKAKLCSEVGAKLQLTKLFGYMNQGILDALREFNRHLVPNGQKPVWVFSYESDEETSRIIRFYPGEERLEIFGGEWI